MRTIITFLFLELTLSCSTSAFHSIKKSDFTKNNPIQFIDYQSGFYTLKQFEYVGECVLGNHLSGDTLTLELLSRNVHSSLKSEYDCIFKNDTLTITIKQNYTYRDTLVFNKAQNKYDTSHIYETPINEYVDPFEPPGKIETFRLKGFKKSPVTIYLDGTYYKKCPTEDIEFKTYKGNIINRINKDGFKNGVWLEFYDTGEVREEKHYENGRLLIGKTFDKNGKDLHYVTESSGGITTLQTDSLFGK